MSKEMFNQYKVLWHYPRMHRIACGELTPPITASIEPSGVCSFNCVWCNSRKYRESEGATKLSKELLRRLPQELKACEVKGVLFTGGGEPLMNWDLLPALELYREAGLSIGLITNGAAIKTDDDTLDIVNNCEFVRLSLDAATAKTFAVIKGVNFSFQYIVYRLEKLVKFRDLFSKTGCKVGVSFLIAPMNVGEVAKAAKLARNIGVDYIQYKPVFFGTKKMLTVSDMEEVNEAIANAKTEEGPDFKVIYMEDQFEQGKVGNKREYGECRANLLTANILSNGKLSVCCQMTEYKSLWFGNLYKQSFKEAWFSDEHRMAVKNIRLPACKPCKFDEYNKMLWAMKNAPEHSNFI